MENSLVESGYEGLGAKVPANRMSAGVVDAELLRLGERLSLRDPSDSSPILAAQRETVVASLDDPISCGLLSI